MHVVHLREVDAIGTSVPDWVGSRWTPHHIVRIDTERGTFEEVNGHPQPHVQVALLAKPVKRGVPWRLLWVAAVVVGWVAAAMLRDAR